MTARSQSSHLSIGEVLSLLQQDFPDVTISKIRFLESQGLIAPERTASGFRKFYDRDIVRLKWILRQQSDHFLPLKVIKKMLDDGVDPSAPAGAESQQTLWPMGQVASGAGGAGEPGTGVSASEVTPTAADRTVGVANGVASSGAEVTGATVGGSTTAASGPGGDVSEGAAHAARGADPAEPSGGGRQGGREGRRYSPTHPSVVATAMAEAAAVARRRDSDTPMVEAGRPSSDEPGRPDGEPRTDPAAVGGGSGGSEHGVEPGDSVGAPQRPSRAIMTPADIVAALQEDPRPRTARPIQPQDVDPVGSTARGSRAFRVEDLVGGTGDNEFLSADEVCEMFDIDPSMLEDLEKFGLLSPRRFAGATSYDGFDVEIIGMAVRYASLGVEARHLRMYKISAEREAGFVEQLVLPILKQRNPAAKQNATERCSDLASMGDELHNLILKRHLRNLLANR